MENPLKKYVMLLHALRQYKMEIAVTLKLKVTLSTLVNDNNLNRTFHAMHDSGAFNEENINEIISMIFAHYEKEELL